MASRTSRLMAEPSLRVDRPAIGMEMRRQKPTQGLIPKPQVAVLLRMSRDVLDAFRGKSLPTVRASHFLNEGHRF